MNKLFFYAGSFLLVFIASKSTASNKLLRNKSPQIKTLKTVEYFVHADSSSVKTKKSTLIQEQDRKGNILNQERYDAQDKLKSHYVYAYNEQGDQIESNTLSASSRIKTYSKSAFTYDDQGRIQIKTYESGNQFKPKKVQSTTEYIYENNLLIEKLTEELSFGKKSHTKFIYTYNQLHKLDTTWHYGNKDFLREKIVYRYHSEGFLVEAAGNRPAQGDANFSVWSKKYDKKGNLIEEVFEQKTGTYFRKTYTYNSKDLLAKFQEYDKNGEITTDESYTYTYDEYGNWITLSKGFADSKHTWITQREIEYYD